MLQEFGRINQALRERNIAVCTLKGFSLVPDFCEEPSLRHQTDFDFLVEPKNVEDTAQVLQSFGYSTPHLSKTEESCFITPTSHIPTERDDIYAVQPQRQIDLHVSVVENSFWVMPELPKDFLAHSEPATLARISFSRLSLEDRFLLQVLHFYRHASRSWIRLSWLFEIAHCLTAHSSNQDLWRRAILRAGNSSIARRIFALVLGLTQRLFQCPISHSLSVWSNSAMTTSLSTWLDHFSVQWAITDWPGGLTNIFLMQDFIPEQNSRNQYLRSRLLPRRTQSFLTKPTKKGSRDILRFRSEQIRYVVNRTARHCKNIGGLSLQWILWKRALHLARRGTSSGPHLELPVGHGGVS